jgi:hypothetical protein
VTRLVARNTPASEGPAPPAVAVAVPVLDGGPRLLALLDAVARQRVDGGIEVLLADSGSRDEAVDEAVRRWPALRCYDVDGPYDHGLVRSALVAAARAPLVALFSQDALPRQDRYLATMADAFADPVVRGAWARQVPGPGADPLVTATLARWCPGPEVVGPAPVVRRLAPGERLDGLPPRQRMAAARFDNVASMVRREAVAALPFPPRPFGEDLAWGARVLRDGGGLAYVPAAVVEHHHEPGLREAFARNRVAHRQAAAEFDLRAVPSPLAGLIALGAGIPSDWRDGGPGWALRGLPRRAAALAGQWLGGREARR